MANKSAAAAAAVLIIAGLTAVVAIVGTRTAPAPVVDRTTPPSPSRYAMVTGRVTINGKPAAGATVRVEAWPNDSVLGQLKDGEAVPEFHVGQAVTGVDGWYEVAIDPSKIPRNYYLSRDPDAAINVELMSRSVAAGAYGTRRYSRANRKRRNTGALTAWTARPRWSSTSKAAPSRRWATPAWVVTPGKSGCSTDLARHGRRGHIGGAALTQRSLCVMDCLRNVNGSLRWQVVPVVVHVPAIAYLRSSSHLEVDDQGLGALVGAPVVIGLGRARDEGRVPDSGCLTDRDVDLEVDEPVGALPELRRDLCRVHDDAVIAVRTRGGRIGTPHGHGLTRQHL